MGCKINSPNPPIFWKFSTNKPRISKPKTITVSSSSFSQNQQEPNSTITAKTDVYRVNFKTLDSCKLGISRYPNFDYNAQGGTGTGIATKITDTDSNNEISVNFDLENLFIPPLTSSTTRFLGLPLPPFLKIDIVPEFFKGIIDQEAGKVNLEFRAKFWFSVGSIYRAPPLLVATVLTSEESNGTIRSGEGERLDGQGKCRLVGVATVDPIDDLFMNTFLGLPTECLAILNASISIST